MTEVLENLESKTVGQDPDLPTNIYSVHEVIRKPLPWHRRLFRRKQRQRECENEPRRIRLMGINSISPVGGARQFLLQIDLYQSGRAKVYNPGFGIPPDFQLKEIRLTHNQKEHLLELWPPMRDAHKAQIRANDKASRILSFLI